jgi:serine/threonine protein kinase
VVITVEGSSGRRWSLNESQAEEGAFRAASFIGWDANNPMGRVWVQRVQSGPDFEEDREHFLRAHAIAAVPSIGACPFIRRVLDTVDGYFLYHVQELAQGSLQDVLRKRDLASDEVAQVEGNVAQALRVIHGAGLIHCDVQTSNVFLIEEVWKLGDLAACVPSGECVKWRPAHPRFRHPEVDREDPGREVLAEPRLDWWGLKAVVADARKE